MKQITIFVARHRFLLHYFYYSDANCVLNLNIMLINNYLEASFLYHTADHNMFSQYVVL